MLIRRGVLMGGTTHLIGGNSSHWLDHKTHWYSTAVDHVFSAGNGVHGSSHVAGTAVT